MLSVSMSTKNFNKEDSPGDSVDGVITAYMSEDASNCGGGGGSNFQLC